MSAPPGGAARVASTLSAVTTLDDQLAAIATTAEIDIEVRVGDDESYVIRFDGSRAARADEADATRRVVFSLSRSGAQRIAAGTANAQQLLADGELRIGGRIDVLQAQAAALAALAGS